jgi:glycosyltransferase involved in cell wall biosynthesis
MRKICNTLNRGIEIAKGEYIARMDSDDISLSERIKVQVEFLDKNLDA